MNKLKLIISFILLISLFLGIVSCAPSPFDLSEEEKAGLEAAILERYHRDKTKPKPIISYVESNRYREWKDSETEPVFLCLGKYDDCFVFCPTYCGVIPNDTRFYLGKYLFYHENIICAYSGGEIKMLWDCYYKGEISDESISELYKIFCEAFEYETKYLPENFILDENEKERFENDIAKEFGISGEEMYYLPNDIIKNGMGFVGNDFVPIYLNEKNQVCYGKFGGYLVFYVQVDTPEKETGFDLGEYHFVERDNREVKAYKDGKFYSIEEAYRNGAFADSNLEIFHRAYCDYIYYYIFSGSLQSYCEHHKFEKKENDP